MEEVKASLVCPCYNSKAGIQPLLDSLQAQDCSFPFEVVFVIDSSGDGLEDYLRSLALPYLTVIVNEERLGIVPSRLKGIELAKGTYVGFVDADDWLEPSFFSKMVSALEKEEADAVDCGFFVNTKPGKGSKYPFRSFYKVLSGKKANKMLLNDFFMRGFLWTKMFKKEILLSRPTILLPKNHLFEDMSYAFACFQKCEKVVYLPASLYHYFEATEGSATSRPNPNRALEHVASFACVRAYADYIKDKELISIVRHSYWRMSLSLGFDISLSKKAGADKASIKMARKELKLLKRKEPLPFEGFSYSKTLQESLKQD